MAASVEEFVELLSSEQHVDIAKLRHLSRHGVHPAVRGEVWMYLLGVLSADKSQEMTSVRALYNRYDALLSAQMRCPSYPQDLSDKINREAERVWRSRIPPRHAARSTKTDSVIRSDTRYTSSASLPAMESSTRRKRTTIRPVQPLNLDDSPLQCSTSPPPPQAVRTLKDHLMSKQGARAASDQHGSSPRSSSPHTDPRIYASDSSGSEDEVVAARASAKGKARADSTDRLSRSISGRSGHHKDSDLLSDDEDAQHRELKEHFIKRVHNVVSVWIRTTALQKKEATALRRRLEQEKAREQAREESHRPSGGESSGAATSRNDAAERTDVPPNPLQPEATEGHATGHNSASSGRRAFSGSDLVPSDSQPSFGPSQGRQSRASEPLNASESELQEDGSDEDLDAEAAFDPAMGMGVEEDNLDFSDDILPLDDAHLRDRSYSRRSHSRAGSARSTPRLEDDYDFELGRTLSGRRNKSTDSLPKANAGLGLGPIDDGGERGASGRDLSFRETSRHLHPRLRPHSRSHHSRTPVSGAASPLASAGYASPHRPRARRPWNASISPTMRSSSRSSDSSSEQGSDDDSEGEGVDEELVEIQRSLWRPYLVQLASPFVLVSGNKRVEAGVYFGFEKLMNIIESYRAEQPLAYLLATFHSLLRRTIPELRTYFDDEGLDITPYVKGWLESLFSGQMKLSDGGCLRLWDAYFSSSAAGSGVNASDFFDPGSGHDGDTKPVKKWGNQQRGRDTKAGKVPSSSSGEPCGSLCAFASQSPLSLHVYVCLALLLQHRDTLEELDRSECEAFLRGLPDDLEVEKILNEAANLRLSHRQAVLAGGDGDGDVFLRGATNGRDEYENEADEGEYGEALDPREEDEEAEQEEDDGEDEDHDSHSEEAEEWGTPDADGRNGAAHSADEADSDGEEYDVDGDDDEEQSGLNRSMYSTRRGEPHGRGRPFGAESRAGSVPVEDDWR